MPVPACLTCLTGSPGFFCLTSMACRLIVWLGLSHLPDQTGQLLFAQAGPPFLIDHLWPARLLDCCALGLLAWPSLGHLPTQAGFTLPAHPDPLCLHHLVRAWQLQLACLDGLMPPAHLACHSLGLLGCLHLAIGHH